ncbi:MAG: hypothetical protein KDJ52_01780 [Anaerolineae bacterium]|nr:hypothetical protein [Anaerolineae bacterium]
MIENAYTDKMLMTLPNKQVVEVEFSFLVDAHRAAIVIRGPHLIYLEIRAHRDAMLEMLAEGAKRFEPVTVSKAAARAMSMPDEMGDPETAWPWLLRNMPWIFKGIDVKREPYAHYLEKSPQMGQNASLLADVKAVRHLGPDPSLADISEVLTGSRQYGGSVYKRVKEVKELLETTTTTTEQGRVVPFEERKAA